jgi:hypothetical protein
MLEAKKLLKHPERVKVRSVALFFPDTYQTHFGITPARKLKIVRQTHPDYDHELTWGLSR